MSAEIKLGVSLFSYSSEYYLKMLSLKDTLRKAKTAGAEGIEIVAAQMMPGFPYPAKAWLHQFRETCGELGLEPFCYSAHLDSGLRSDRWMTDAEKVESTVNDIRNAYEMGASAVRTQQTITPKLLYEVAPWAERYQIRVGVEIHPPHRLETEVWQEFLKVFKDLDTPYVGMVLDTGIYQEYPYDGWLGVYKEHGVTEEICDGLLEILGRRGTKEEARQFVEAHGGNAYGRELSEELFSLYRPYEPDELAENMKYVTHFHTKFYHMEHGEEKTIPYDRILEIIKSSGFKGYLISEYEGHYCYDAHQYPAADQVKAHIEMEKRLLGL